MSKVVLDYIEKIEIEEDELPLQNIQALEYLRKGIFALVNATIAQEKKLDPTLQFHTGSSLGEIACYFHWFAISIINYARVVALLRIMHDNNWSLEDIATNKKTISRHCTRYAQLAIPEVYEWRNKIAAHFAITDPWDENLATLEFSLMQPVSFINNHYFVNALTWHNSDEVSSLTEWSLVEVFEKSLVPRYWPNCTYKD